MEEVVKPRGESLLSKQNNCYHVWKSHQIVDFQCFASFVGDQEKFGADVDEDCIN